MNLPQRIFFTGVPGSRWSAIAQFIEEVPGVNTTDRTPRREYDHSTYSGHRGAYFGRGMEFEALVNESYVDQAHYSKEGTRLIKGHDWAYMLDEIQDRFYEDWIMLVYRPDLASQAWWHEAGGFNIKYPDYSIYKNSRVMLQEIMQQNEAILEFAYKNDAQWNHFTPQWVVKTFGHQLNFNFPYSDILVTIIK
jgi:hypothetical protein